MRHHTHGSSLTLPAQIPLSPQCSTLSDTERTWYCIADSWNRCMTTHSGDLYCIPSPVAPDSSPIIPHPLFSLLPHLRLFPSPTSLLLRQYPSSSLSGQSPQITKLFIPTQPLTARGRELGFVLEAPQALTGRGVEG